LLLFPVRWLGLTIEMNRPKSDPQKTGVVESLD